MFIKFFNFMFNFLKFKLIQKWQWLGYFLHWSDGFLPDEIDERDDIFGSSTRYKWKIVKPNSDWTKEANQIVAESQKSNRLETMNCVINAVLNAMEMLCMAKYGELNNWSERYVGKMAGTTRQGNTPRNAFNAIRKNGVVNEEDWSWKRDKFCWNDYYAPIPKNILEKGKAWLNSWELGYDAIYCSKQSLIEALKYSPVPIAVYAWYFKNGKYYSIARQNHYCVLINRSQVLVYDSYQPYIKDLDENFKFAYAKRIWLEKKPDTLKNEKFDLELIAKLLQNGIKYLMRVHKNGQVYKLDENGLKYISPDDLLQEQVRQDFKDGVIQPRSEEDFAKLILK